MSIFRRGFLAITLLAVASLATNCAWGAYRMERVVGGLNQPIYVTQAPGDNLNLYIIERITPPGESPGRILKYNPDTGSTSVLHQFTASTTSADGGVLMMAFHPDFATNGKFYTATAFLEGSVYRNRVQEFDVVNGVASVNRTVLEYDNFGGIHTVDWLGFNPLATGDARDHLYVTMGDGGIQIINSQFQNRAQDLSQIYGKMLRIDISPGEDDYPADPKKNFGVPDDNPFANDGNPGTLDEIYASGFRNPYRASFDRTTGDIFIADVGFGTREEIDFLKAGTSGKDFGWAKREGTLPSTDPDHAGLQGDSLNPIYEYAHQNGQTAIRGFSITGGYVYRGSIPELQGRYFFADYVFGQIYSVAYDRNTDPTLFNGLNATGLINHYTQLNASIPGGGQSNYVTSFGEDNAGNLYVVDFGYDSPYPTLGQGEIFRIVPALEDGDYNRDGKVNAADYALWRDTLTRSVASGEGADGNFTGIIDAGDYNTWKANFGDGIPGSGNQTAVPEPTSLSIALLLGLAGWQTVRRRA